MIKYYFGYVSGFGNPCPVLWTEEDGKAIGGEVNFIPGNRVSITMQDFMVGDTVSLQEKYPFRRETTE